jgi:ferredoxin
MRRVPVIDMRACSDCGACLELCPLVFKKDEVSGSIEVRDLSEYPEDAIQEAISYCPRDCISWEDEG